MRKNSLLEYFAVHVDDVYSSAGFAPMGRMSKKAVAGYEKRHPGLRLAGVIRNMPILDLSTHDLVRDLRAEYVNEIEYLKQELEELQYLAWSNTNVEHEYHEYSDMLPSWELHYVPGGSE